MPKKDDDILAAEFEKMGRIGAGWVSRLLPNDRERVSLDVALPASSQMVLDSLQNDESHLARILALARRIFETEGELCESEETPSTVVVRGLIGAGYWNMNPALVKVHIPTRAHDHIRLLVEGQAKEGIVKQHAGKQAAQRVAQLLVDRLRERHYEVLVINKQMEKEKKT